MSFILNKKVYAECSNDEKEKYKKLVENIRINYNYLNETDNSNNFSLSISNLPKEIYIITYPVYVFTNDTDNKYINITSGPIDGGTNVKISYYTSDNSTCPDQLLKTSTFNIPVYNEYWNDELCKGIEDFKYCSKFISNKITYEGFKKNVLKYKNSINETEEIIENKNEGLLQKNLIIVITIFILLMLFLALIIVIFKGKRKVKNL